MVSDEASLPRQRSHITTLVVACVLLAAFVIAVSNLQRDSLWSDEAWTDWAVRTPFILTTLERVRGDVHPPLYFLLLNGLVRLTGDSVLALRWPSALFGLIGAAATYAVGKRVFDGRTGLFALFILATHSFFVYYTREARMYSLLLALGALSTMLYWRWQARPTVWRALVYGVCLAATIYTHYAGVLIIGTHVVHLGLRTISTRGLGTKWYWLPVPYIVTLLLYAPWLPTFVQQMRANPGGPLALPVATDGKTIAALLLILTSGHWLLVIGPAMVGIFNKRLKRHLRALSLLALWLLITPTVLLLLNAWFTPVYQVRCTIAILPAGALLVAFGLRQLEVSRIVVVPTPFRWLVILYFLGWLAYTQLAMYTEYWESKPDWETTMRTVATVRQPLEPFITDFAPSSPAAYYNRQLTFSGGVALDLSWRLYTAAEARARTDIFQRSHSVWVALPINSAKTWPIVSRLDQTRHVGYRAALQNMIFYRFDAGDGDSMRFRFGDHMRYVSGMEADQQFSLQAGGELCPDIHLRTLQSLDNSYSYGLHVVDWAGTAATVQWDAGLGMTNADEDIILSPCLAIPAGVPPGHYHLEFSIYNWSTEQRLPLVEDGAGEAFGWGDVMVLAAVDVTG